MTYTCFVVILITHIVFSFSNGFSFYHPGPRTKIREFFIAAVDIEWDYAPSGRDLVNENQTVFNIHNENREDRIGSIYTKIVYRRFTDSTYLKEIPNPKWAGIVGPIIKAEFGDIVKINFKNLANGNESFSMHPHGFHYLKDSEGALYIDGTDGPDKGDDMVGPGQTHIFFWNLTENFVTAKDDENCAAWAYHSHTKEALDVNAGLIGLLLSCRKGILAKDGWTRRDGYRDIVLYTEIILEAASHRFQRNIQKCGNPELCKQLAETNDPEFGVSNIMYSFNGFGFGNLQIDVEEGEKIAWHSFEINTGAHGIAIFGQTFKYLKRRVFTIPVYPAFFVSAKLIPPKPGKWLIHCRVTTHFRGGMLGYLNVKRSRKSVRPEILDEKTREYFIAAEEVMWDYALSDDNLIDGGKLTDPGSPSAPFFATGPERVGGKYKKARFIEYTDRSFTRRKRRTEEEEHLGILGPTIRLEVGEKVRVTFKNLASREYSFNPTGVVLDKREEGAVYRGGYGINGKTAQPGQVVTYTFSAPASVAPTGDDAQCLTYAYQSVVDYVKDLYSGLVGTILVCKRGSLKRRGLQKYVDKEFSLFFITIDENESWYLDDNIKLNSLKVNKTDEGFVRSNFRFAINGLSFGHLKGLDMCLNDKVSWHVFGIGSRFDVHGTHFHGNTLKIFGSTQDSSPIVPGLSYTGLMVPDNPGTWQVICRTLAHHDSGMRAVYNVGTCGRYFKEKRRYGNQRRRIRKYYIAAVEMDWEYCPKKVNFLTSGSLLDPKTPGHIFVKRDDGKFIGSKYRKVLYREYTDGTFSKQKVRGPEEIHLGMMGPFIKATVGEDIIVVFKNMADRPYSIHPHGVFYDKFNEGAVYEDGVPDNGDSVQPGNTYTYRWKVPERAGPSLSESNCKTWAYYSAVNVTKDKHTGLFGPLVVCRRGLLNRKNIRVDVDHEYALSFFVVNENQSWLIEKNKKMFAPNRTTSDPEFVRSNLYFMMNGYIYDNLPGLTMNVQQHIDWHLIGLGSSLDFHSVHFHGQLFIHRTNAEHTGDVTELVPATFQNVQMITDNPGIWLVHCHVSQHMPEGMAATYEILPEVVPSQRKRINKNRYI